MTEPMGGVRKVYLSLGSNQGDRQKYLSEAQAMLEDAFGTPCSAVSSVVESESWGFEGGDFLNRAVCFDTALGAREILGICKDIERRLGRRENIEYDASRRRIYHDRPIDIDILLCGDEKIDEPGLVVPHPMMHMRDFIMRPLMEILPEKH